MRVAITRAMPQAQATAERVRALGHEALLAPLLNIKPRAFDQGLDGVQALLFTSGNGVRAFAGACELRDYPVLGVGEATAAAARAAGFTKVASADGDVGALTALARATLDPNAGALVHMSGARVAGTLVEDLRAAGFNAERRNVYEARAAARLPEAFAGPLDLVLFHSPRAAETFMCLGAPQAARLIAACLSPAVAAAAGRVTWARLIVSPAPREAALLRAALAPASGLSGTSA